MEIREGRERVSERKRVVKNDMDREMEWLEKDI
jgi:hypothetical protein